MKMFASCRGSDEHHFTLRLRSFYNILVLLASLGFLALWSVNSSSRLSVSGFSVGCILLYCVTYKKMSGVGWASQLISRVTWKSTFIPWDPRSTREPSRSRTLARKLKKTNKKQTGICQQTSNF
jgi:hypothetical protein